MSALLPAPGVQHNKPGNRTGPKDNGFCLIKGLGRIFRSGIGEGEGNELFLLK